MNLSRTALTPAILRSPVSLKVGRNAGGKSVTRIRLAVTIFLVWTAVGMFQAVPGMFNVVDWHFFYSKVIEAWAWALITAVIVLIDRKLSLGDRNIGRLVAIFLALSVPFSVLYTVLAGILLYPFPQIWWNPLRNHDFAVYYFMGGWFTYCAIVGILECAVEHPPAATRDLPLVGVYSRGIQIL